MEKITISKKKMLLDHVFFANDLYKGKGLLPNNSIGTFCTDGEAIMYNPAFTESHEIYENIFALCHEIMHIRMNHMCWIKGKDFKIGNMALDYVVNMTLKDFGMKVPPWVLCDEKYRNCTKDQVYEMLMKKKEDEPEQGQDKGNGKPGQQGQSGQPEQDEKWNIGEVKEYTGNKSEKELEHEMKQRTIEGVRQLKSRGEIPGAFKDYLSDILNEPPMPWEEIFLDKLRSRMEGELTWETLDRRYIAHDIYLPGEKGEYGKAIAVLDTSGSITKQIVSQSVAQLRHVTNQVSLKMTLVQCDSEIQEIEDDWIPSTDLVIKGMGGTDFRPVFNAIDDGTLTGDIVIFFTDLYGTFPEDEPAIPVFWIDYDGTHDDPPFGTRIIAKE